MEKPDDNSKELRYIDSVFEKKNKLESPSSNFTHRVMMNLHSMPVASALSPKNGLLLLCGTIVAVTILTFLVSAGIFDSANQTITIDKLPDLEVTKNFNPTFAINGKLIMNGLILLNIVLAFILLDRTVLRPYFNRRMSS
jgi:hypothetical protein